MGRVVHSGRAIVVSAVWQYLNVLTGFKNMAADKSPSRFARLREALSYRLPLLYVVLLVALAVLFFWLTVAWSGQRLRLFLLSLITLFAIVLPGLKRLNKATKQVLSVVLTIHHLMRVS